MAIITMVVGQQVVCRQVTQGSDSTERMALQVVCDVWYVVCVTHL